MMFWDIMRRNPLYVLHICLRYKFLTSCTYDCTRGLLYSWCKLWMKLWHKSHQEKCLTHSALDEDSATGVLQLTTHPLDAARHREGGTSRGWRGGLMPSTGRRSALTPDQPPGLSSLLLHALFLLSSLCVSRWCSTDKVELLSVQRRSRDECQETFRTFNASS